MSFFSKVGIALGGTVVQKGVAEAAQKASAEILQKAATEAGQKLAKETFQRTLNENVQRYGREIATEMATEASEKTFKETYQKTLKEGTEQSTQEFTERAAREGAEETTEKTIKETAEKTVKEAGQKTLSKSKKILLAGVVAAGGALAYASIQSASNNGEIVNIKSIKKVSDEPMGGALGGLLSLVTDVVTGQATKKTTVNIIYSPKLKICSQDIITLSETNCEPKIEGNFRISKIISDTELEIEVDLVITKNGDSGLLVLNTDVGKQLQCLTEDLGDAVGGVAGGAAGAALSAMFKGIEKIFGDYIWVFWLFIAAIVLAVVGSILGPIITLTKSLFGSSNKIQPAPQLQPELQLPQDE